MPDKNKITISMSLADFEYYERMEAYAKNCIRMFEKANTDDDGAVIAVMTPELETVIKEIYLPESQP